MALQNHTAFRSNTNKRDGIFDKNFETEQMGSGQYEKFQDGTSGIPNTKNFVQQDSSHYDQYGQFSTTHKTLEKQQINNSSTPLSSKSCYLVQPHMEVKLEQVHSSDINRKCSKTLERCRNLTRKQGFHSLIAMETAGFRYTNDGDTARCDACQLEVSGWTLDMKPFTIHSERSPNCTFVRSVQSSNPVFVVSSSPSSITTLDRTTSDSNEQAKPSKRQKTEETTKEPYSQTFTEIETLKQVRRRSFSHWPHRSSPSRAQMIDAGFHNCNVGDRVICLYCNLICQQWTPHSDDPCEVHKTLSPQCAFVINILIRRETTSILIVNANSAGNRSTTAATTDTFRSNEIVLTAACNAAYIEIPKRHASFTNWPNEALPAVDDLVRAGFFYTGTKTIVTCFYCNGSLQNWGANDNPTIEHARWFPHCSYAKQLCGDDLYRKIQESKRAAQERARATDSANTVTSNSQKLQIPDESTLSRLVAARLDLPVSQRLLDQNFKLSIIKRCWEDQLRLKQDDFETDCDLLMACVVLQKQIDHINGRKENIVVPSVKMRQIREREQHAGAPAVSSSVPPPATTLSTSLSATSDVEMTGSSQSSTTDSTRRISAADTAEQRNISSTIPTVTDSKPKETTSITLKNPCALCMSEEKRLACIPCGHLATCVPCGHSLRTCPICRREIEAFVRIYI